MNQEIMMANFDKVNEVSLSDFSLSFGSMLDKVKGMQVSTNEAFKEITRYYKSVKDWKKAIEAWRKQKTEPLRSQISAINDKVKDFVAPLDEIEQLAKVKVDQYTKQLQIEKDIQLIELRTAADMIGVDVPVENTSAKALRGDGALVYEKTVKRFEVTSLCEVPLKYLMIDEKKLKQDIELGIVQIPGIKIWDEKTTQIRSR